MEILIIIGAVIFFLLAMMISAGVKDGVSNITKKDK